MSVCDKINDRDLALVTSVLRKLDYPAMRPDDQAEVTRKLIELNGAIL